MPCYGYVNRKKERKKEEYDNFALIDNRLQVHFLLLWMLLVFRYSLLNIRYTRISW